MTSNPSPITIIASIIAAFAIAYFIYYLGELWQSSKRTVNQLIYAQRHCHDLQQRLNNIASTNQTLRTRLMDTERRLDTMRDVWSASLRIIHNHERTEKHQSFEIKKMENEIRSIEGINQKLRENIKEQESLQKELSTVKIERDLLMDRVIQNQLSKPSDTVILSQIKPPIHITVRDLETLREGVWLNDEVINGYLSLLIMRQNQRHNTLRVLFMNSFFYTKLTEKNKRNQDGYNYNAVRRWTKPSRLAAAGVPDAKTIFDADKVIIPLHLRYTHWAVVCVNMKRKQIEVYDSSYNPLTAEEIYRNIYRYVMDEHETKMEEIEIQSDKENVGEGVVASQWQLECNEDQYPQQSNQNDCGVFMLQCCKSLADDRFPSYGQSDMPMLRKQMMSHIICGVISS